MDPGDLDEKIAWLNEHGYQITRVDAARWSTEEDLHRDIAAALDFPDYYGRNLDALNDCMRDVVAQQYGWTPGTAGLVLVFTGYDAFARSRPRAARIVLDIMADQSRSAARYGRHFICLVRSSDPHIRFEPIGAMPAAWHDES